MNDEDKKPEMEVVKKNPKELVFDANNIKPDPVMTGELMFQFGTEDPVRIAKIMDEGDAVLVLSTQKADQPDNIEFKSKGGLIFKLFINKLNGTAKEEE